MEERKKICSRLRRIMRAAAAMVLLAAVLMAAGCSPELSGRLSRLELCREMSEGLNLSISYGSVTLISDTHGGFLGDGTLYAAAYLPRDAEEVIKQNPNWRPFPLGEAAERLFYGRGDAVGPLLSAENGESLFPRITSGYYIIIDRFDDEKNAGGAVTDDARLELMLRRAAFNFTAAVYDSDTGTLYYAEMDT